MRELDQELDFGRGRDPFVTVDTADGPQIVRMSRPERRARNLPSGAADLRLTLRAERAERNIAGTLFQRWVTGSLAAALHRAVAAPGASWQDAYRTLAGFGCTILPKGSRMVVTTTLSSGRILAAKASILRRRASKVSLSVLSCFAIASSDCPAA